ncbi:SGNH hydrolase [Panus rudis PR-1116 ss-1]|nr:SGNH hydrolase [Panus rudis PR-1116 ss-1]
MLTSAGLLLGGASAITVGGNQEPNQELIPHNHPLIYYHGRWDAAPGSWWAGSGFKLHVENLQSLALNLGNHTTTPQASLGVSIDYHAFQTVNVSAGSNIIFTRNDFGKERTSVVRINAEGWQNNRVNLESVVLNRGARLLPYTPSRLTFQFIGDSLSAGQYLPSGVDQAWPFLTSEYFKAEYRVNAQPGATLTDMVSYGNVHGMSFQFFKTEDTGFYYTSDHNFTTDWDFRRDVPTATHVVIHIGANDASTANNVPQDAFIQTYLDFLAHIRRLYPNKPIFIFTPWGWPSADGTVSYYYPGAYEKIVNTRHTLGDKEVFLVDTTGWVTWHDVFPDNIHPNVPGHAKIAGLFAEWLETWGLHPEAHWSTTV